MSDDYCYLCLLSHPTGACRNAPRCLKCGVRLPLHVADCPTLLKPKDETRDALPGRDARESYEVTERSRFDFPWGDAE